MFKLIIYLISLNALNITQVNTISLPIKVNGVKYKSVITQAVAVFVSRMYETRHYGNAMSTVPGKQRHKCIFIALSGYEDLSKLDVDVSTLRSTIKSTVSILNIILILKGVC